MHDSDMDMEVESDDVDNSYTNEDIEELEAQAGLTGQTEHLDINQRLELLAKYNVKLNKPRAQRRPPIGGKWSLEEDSELKSVVDTHGPKNWKKIAELLGDTRTDVQCLHRWNKVLKPGLHKGPWLEYEDVLVRDMVLLYGVGKVKWSSIAAQLPGRIGKQCRERWFNHLDPAIKKGDWALDEDTVLYEAQKQWGNRWCEIAKMLPGRTENAVKNRWNSSSMKKWLKDNHLSVGPAYGPNTVPLYEDCGVSGSGFDKDRVGEVSNRKRKMNETGHGHGHRVRNGDNDVVVGIATENTRAHSTSSAGPVATTSTSLLSKMPAHLRPPMISTTPLVTSCSSSSGSSPTGEECHSNTHSTINNLLNVGPQTSKHLIELLTTTFHSPLHPSSSHHSIDQVLGLNNPTTGHHNPGSGLRSGTMGGIALNNTNSNRMDANSMEPFSPLSNQYSPTGLYNDHDDSHVNTHITQPHLPPPSGMLMLFDEKKNLKKKEKEKYNKKNRSPNTNISANTSAHSDFSLENHSKKRKYNIHTGMHTNDGVCVGVSAHATLSPIDKAVQFLRQKLDALNNSNSNDNRNPNGTGTGNGSGTGTGTGTGMDEIPLELLPFFNILNYDAQRALVKQLVEKFQRTSLTPRGNMSLNTPRFGVGMGLGSTTHQNHLASANTPSQYHHSHSHSQPAGGNSGSNLNDLKEILGLQGQGNTPRNHGAATVSFDPNCFEDNSIEMNGDSSELNSDIYSNTNANPNSNPSSQSQGKSGRGRGKKQIALEQQQQQQLASHRGHSGTDCAGITMGEGDDVSIQAAVLITYQVASKCASIDELLQIFLPQSEHELDQGGDGSSVSNNGNGDDDNDNPNEDNSSVHGNTNTGSELDNHYTSFPFPSPSNFQSGSFSNVEIKSPTVIGNGSGSGSGVAFGYHSQPDSNSNNNENFDNTNGNPSNANISPYTGLDQDFMVESSFKKKSPRNKLNEKKSGVE